MSDPTASSVALPRPGWAGQAFGGLRRRLGGALGTLGIGRQLEAEQDRWFLWLPVLLGAGIGLYFRLGEEPPLLAALAALLAAVALRIVAPAGVAARVATGVMLTLALGFAAAKLRTDWVAQPALVRETGTVRIAGWIEDIEPRQKGAYRVVIRLARMERAAEGELPYRVRVRVTGSKAALRVGTPVAARAKLLPPPLPALAGDYDFARRAYFQRLGAVGYARAPLEPAPDIGPAPLSIAIWAPVENLRRRVAERINAVLAGDQAAIAVALIQGDQGAISDPAMAAMRDSGLAHILSISGLHMAIMAGALFWSIRALLALSPGLAQAFPVRSLAAVFACAGALFYLLLSGCQVPAVRSFIMIAIMFAAIVLGRTALSLRNVAVAAFVLLLLRPENLLDVSFLMSFAATTGLVALYEEIGARRRNQDEPPEPAGPVRHVARMIAADVLTTFVAGLSVAPLSAYFFHNYQHYSALGNLLALPIVTFCLMPLVLIVMLTMPLGLDAVPLWLMGWGIEALLAVGRFVASLPGAVAAIPAMPVGAVIGMMLGALWLALWRRRWRWLGLLGVAAGLWQTTGRVPPDLLIGRDGATLAIRLADGTLSALSGRGGKYEVTRWLEHDGDRRGLAVAARGEGFRCDNLGCTATVKGMGVVLVSHPAALAEECGKADIVVLRFPRSRGCAAARLVIDLADLRAKGTHWVRIADGQPIVTSMAEHRGQRPWAREWGARRSPVKRAGAAGQGVPPAGFEGRSPNEGAPSEGMPSMPDEDDPW